MASTQPWNVTSVSVSAEQISTSFTPTHPDQWETKPVTAENVSSTAEEIITLEQTTSTRGVTNETNFNDQWSSTQTTILGNNTFHQTSNLSSTTQTSRADENFTNTQDLGGRSVFTSSVVTATFSEIINETDVTSATESTKSMSAYEEFQIALFVTLSIVIGCFAITAISLRIRSRIKKRRHDAEASRKQKRLREGSTKPTVRRVTIRMGRRASCSVKTNKTPVRCTHSPSLQSRAKIPQIQTESSLDRNRTLDALLDAGTYPPPYQFPSTVKQHRSRSDLTSSKTKLLPKNIVHDASEHAYDNQAISCLDVVPVETSILSQENSLPLRMTCDVDVHHSNHVSMTTQNGSDSDDASAGEKSNCIESSETESLSDAKKRLRLNQYFGMMSNQRNDSKDSGYVESFISQDSLRLRAMTALEEGRPLGVDQTLSHGQDRMMSRLGSIEPSLFMASVDETSASINLNRSSSVRSDYQDKFMGRRRSRYSVPSYPSHSPHYFQRSTPNNLSPYHEMYGTVPVMSYQTNMMRYPSSDSSVYDCSSIQSDYGSLTRKHNHSKRVLPKSLSYDMSLNKYQAHTSPRGNDTLYQDCAALNRRAKRFVKRRSLGTQTVDPDMTPDDNVKSLVQWDYDSSGNLFASRRKMDRELDFIGPVYMAEELQESNGHNVDFVIEMNNTVSTSV